jgi:hypothetical protein
MIEPQVRFAMVPVIALARLEAMKAAALATSARVERDIDPAGLLDDRIEMLLDRLRIEGVDVRHLGCSPRDGYLRGHGVER